MASTSSRNEKGQEVLRCGHPIFFMNRAVVAKFSESDETGRIIGKSLGSNTLGHYDTVLYDNLMGKVLLKFIQAI
jgi:hypothetical protein